MLENRYYVMELTFGSRRKGTSRVLYTSTQKYPKENMGLYRDDGLAAFKNTSGPEKKRTKKDFQRIFKEKGLDLVIVCNRKSVD